MNFSEWRKIELGELIDSISIKHKFDKNQLIFLNTSDVLEGKVLHQNYSDINTLPGQAKKSIKKGDILFSEIRPKNKRFALVDFDADDYVVSTKLMVLRRKNSLIDNLFLYKYLTSDRILEELQFIAEGRSGTFPQITFNELKSLKISLPLLNEQKAIVDILSSLDDKIELNNQMNKTLEEMAQALFKRWFVDFEFPNEEGQPYKSSGGEMVESELGMIPNGWNIKNLSDIVDNFDSKRIPLSKREREKREKIYPYYGAASIADYVDDFIFDGCYVLMGEDGTVIDNNGYPILQYVWGKFWVNNHAHVLQGKNYYSNEFVYLKLKSTNVQSLVTGAVQPKINQKNMNSIKTVVAPKEIHIKFNQLMESIYSKYRLNIEQNESLKQLRDSILPKLMSGEIRVIDLC